MSNTDWAETHGTSRFILNDLDLNDQRKWARIGPKNERWMIQTPRACICLSVFVVALKGKSSIVLYRPRESEEWPKFGGQPAWTSRKWEKSGLWYLPGTHLLMEESPDNAAVRIMREFTGLVGTNPKLLMVQSHLRPAKLWKWMKAEKGANHWDICFVYETHIRKLPAKIRPWFKEIRIVGFSEIGDQVRMNDQADILEEAGYLRTRTLLR